MRYKYINNYTYPEQITSITINGVTTSTRYDNVEFDSLVDSQGIGKPLTVNSEPEYNPETEYLRATYTDGETIVQGWEVVAKVPTETEKLHVKVENTTNAINEIMTVILPNI